MDTEPSFTAVRSNLSETLVQGVLELVRLDGLKPGDKLPPVRALAQRFSVATPTVREALRKLEATGIVEIRHGSGVYLCQEGERMVLPNRYYGGLQAKTILDLLEARLVIEPYLAALAARRATKADITMLEAPLQAAETCLNDSPGKDALLQKSNMRFHSAIAALSQNRVLGQVLMSLVELHQQEQLAVLQLYDDRLRDHLEHKSIFAAIRAKQPLKARKLMTQHLEGVKATIERRLGGDATHS